MAKQSPLHLVPQTGKRLADVARNVELQAALCSTLLAGVVRDRPEIKNKMILELRRILANPKLSPHQREIYRAALHIVNNLLVTT